MINENDVGLYVMLAMKNLYFLNIQTENVVSEIGEKGEKLVKEFFEK